MNTIYQLYPHLSKKRLVQVFFVIALMFVSSIAEVVSIGALLPFITALTDPNILWNYEVVQVLARKLGFIQAEQLTFPFLLIFISLTVLSNFVKLLNKYASLKLTASIGSELNSAIYRAALHQPYEKQIQQNSSELVSTVTDKINRLMSAFGALLNLINSVLCALFIAIGLIYVDWITTISAVFVFGILYLVIALTISRKIKSNSQRRRKAVEKTIKLAQEGLGSIRDIILDNNQGVYVKEFAAYDRQFRNIASTNAILRIFPRYIVEATAVIAIALFGYFSIFYTQNPSLITPLLGTFVLGAQKLLPNLQQIFTSWALIKDASSDRDAVFEMLNYSPRLITPSRKEILFSTRLNVVELSYKYKASSKNILKGVNFTIRAGETVGIVGSTGSGKSTLVDILMGLLPPSKGLILVDGKDIYDKLCPDILYSWRASIAHVPQSIYLTDGTILENIALGVAQENIDYVSAQNAAKKAGILSFIESLPNGMQTMVGERGICLSGGQRQRIGIARALFKNAQVLILDEATSALDNETEKLVMNSLLQQNQKLTIIMIAHRLSTLEACDKIYKVADGEVLQVYDLN